MKKRIYGFQAIRAVACLSVVIAHLVYLIEVNYGMTPAVSLNYPTRYGMLDIATLFLAISGFIVAKTISKADEHSNPLRFMLKRMARIYPTYWLAIGIYLMHFTIGDMAIRALKPYLPIWTVYVIGVCVATSVGYVFGGLSMELDGFVKRKFKI